MVGNKDVPTQKPSLPSSEAHGLNSDSITKRKRKLPDLPPYSQKEAHKIARQAVYAYRRQLPGTGRMNKKGELQEQSLTALIAEELQKSPRPNVDVTLVKERIAARLHAQVKPAYTVNLLKKRKIKALEVLDETGLQNSIRDVLVPNRTFIDIRAEVKNQLDSITDDIHKGDLRKTVLTLRSAVTSLREMVAESGLRNGQSEVHQIYNRAQEALNTLDSATVDLEAQLSKKNTIKAFGRLQSKKGRAAMEKEVDAMRYVLEGITEFVVESPPEMAIAKLDAARQMSNGAKYQSSRVKSVKESERGDSSPSVSSMYMTGQSNKFDYQTMKTYPVLFDSPKEREGLSHCVEEINARLAHLSDAHKRAIGQTVVALSREVNKNLDDLSLDDRRDALRDIADHMQQLDESITAFESEEEQSFVAALESQRGNARGSNARGG